MKSDDELRSLPNVLPDQQGGLESLPNITDPGYKAPNALTSAVKRVAGRQIQGIGQGIEDAGIEAGSALTDRGQRIARANPAYATSLDELADRPVSGVGEILTETGTQVASAALGSRLLGAVGQRFAGPVGREVGEHVGMAAAIAPQVYGGIREQQQAQGIDDIPRALLATAASTAVERLGLESKAARLLGGKSNLLKPGQSRAKEIIREGAKGAASESIQEGIQSNIERVGAYMPLDTPEAIEETAFAATAGAIGGGGIGGALGAVTPRAQEQRERDAEVIAREAQKPDAGPLTRAVANNPQGTTLDPSSDASQQQAADEIEQAAAAAPELVTDPSQESDGDSDSVIFDYQVEVEKRRREAIDAYLDDMLANIQRERGERVAAEEAEAARNRLRDELLEFEPDPVSDDESRTSFENALGAALQREQEMLSGDRALPYDPAAGNRPALPDARPEGVRDEFGQDSEADQKNIQARADRLLRPEPGDDIRNPETGKPFSSTPQANIHRRAMGDEGENYDVHKVGAGQFVLRRKNREAENDDANNELSGTVGPSSSRQNPDQSGAQRNSAAPDAGQPGFGDKSLPVAGEPGADAEQAESVRGDAGERSDSLTDDAAESAEAAAQREAIVQEKNRYGSFNSLSARNELRQILDEERDSAKDVSARALFELLNDRATVQNFPDQTARDAVEEMLPRMTERFNDSAVASETAAQSDAPIPTDPLDEQKPKGDSVLDSADLGDGTQARLIERADGKFIVTGHDVDSDQPFDVREYPSAEAARQAFERAKVQARQSRQRPEIESRVIDGVEPAVVTTPAGRDIDVEYRVVEAGQLISSNRDDGGVNPDYPAFLQPRDRTRAASQSQVLEIAANLNPRLLGEGPSTTDGAPIVSREGVVESGNGRTMALRRAYQQNGESAAKYRAWLQEQGYDLEGMQQPVLVRVRQSEMTDQELADYTKESNQRTTLSMSVTEQAQADGQKVLPIVGDYAGGDVTSAANRDFVRKFVRDVAGQSERGDMMDGEGQLSQSGRRRIEAAMLAAAYGDERLIADVFESSDTDIRGIGGALLDASGHWAQMRGAAAQGAIADGVDLTDDLIEAVNLVRRARADGTPISEMVNQGDIFSGDVGHNVQEFVALFYRGEHKTRARSRQKVADGLIAFADLAMDTKPGDGLFGDNVSGEQILSTVNERVRNEEGQGQSQASLFAGGPADGPSPRESGGDGQRPVADADSPPVEAGPEQAAEAVEPDKPAGNLAPALPSYAKPVVAPDNWRRSIKSAKAYAESIGMPTQWARSTGGKADLVQRIEQYEAQLANGEHYVGSTFLQGFGDLSLGDFIRGSATAQEVVYKVRQIIFNNESQHAQLLLQRHENGKADRWNGTGSIEHVWMRDGQLVRGDDANQAVPVQKTDKNGAVIQPAMADQTDSAQPSVSESLANATDAELSALFDESVEETRAPQTEKPKSERERTVTRGGRRAPRRTSSRPERVDTNDQSGVDRTASEIAKSMGVNLGSAGTNALKGLTKLFGGNGRLNSGLSFDEETYAEAKPHFQAMLKDFDAAGRDLKDFIRALIDAFGTGIKPYLLRFAQELRDERASNGNRRAEEIERDIDLSQREKAGDILSENGRPYKSVPAANRALAELPETGDRARDQYGVYRVNDREYVLRRWDRLGAGNGAIDAGWIDQEAARTKREQQRSAVMDDNGLVEDDFGNMVTPEEAAANARLTAETAGEMRDGDVVQTLDGEEFLTLRTRTSHALLEAAPIIDGRAQVSADTTVVFHLNPETASQYPERSHDALYRAGWNYYDEQNAQQEGLTNDERASADTERAREAGDDAGIAPDPGNEGRGPGGSSATESGGRPNRRITEAENAVGDGGAATDRESGGIDAGSEKSRLENDDAGSADDSGSAGDSTGGLWTERDASESVSEVAQKAPARRQQLNESASEIREVMPFLTEGQAADVEFAEARFAKPDGFGVLFTNGTGTGKTFSGLGIAKRFAMSGKSNIFIVVPKQTIADAWIDAGKDFFGLDVSRLESTKDAGQGIVITTYANLGENPALVSRDWDLVIADESHYLSSDQQGSDTRALDRLRAMTLKRNTGSDRIYALNQDKVEQRKELQSKADYYSKIDDQRALIEAKSYQDRADAISSELQDMITAENERLEALPDSQRPRAVMLSATPFAYEKNVRYAQGFLFDWGSDKDGLSYNSGSNYEQFMMQHFGYRMRYNKLTAPEAEVDSGLMQRAFNSWLKKEGVLSSRRLDSDFDYDRRFILTENAIGQRVDQALEWLREHSHGDNEIDGMSDVHEKVLERFGYHERMYFLEALKAREALPIIRAHLDLGRNVLVLHDFKKGGVVNPFRFSMADDDAQQANAAFRAEFQDLIDSFDSIPGPIDLLTATFPDALVYNGSVSAKRRVKMQDEFNSDSDGTPRLMIAQGDAMREGVSVHDTTGNHQRLLLNLGMPVKPVAAIQQEGRIFRTGQASNAMFRYLTIGTNWERMAFASKIAGRAGTAENLALGEEARGLKQAFIDAYEQADEFPPGFEGEGTGGRETDAAYVESLTPWDMAKSLYFGTKKFGKGRSDRSRAHSEYFATPEPLGLKMVQWADIRGNESILEPSAGHGAIARFFPENAKGRAIELTNELASKLALHFNGDLQVGAFEDHNVINKYDAIVMNPPFGSGGKTAIEHLEKATQHLNYGGRVVALIPTGPAADKRFEKWFYAEDSKGNVGNPELHLVSSIALPRVAFERAGTSVAARVVIIDRVKKGERPPQQTNRDYANADTIQEFFDRIEHAELPERRKPVEQAPEKPARASEPADDGEKVARDGREIVEHTTRRGKVIKGIIAKDMSKDQAKAIDKYTFKKDGGWFIREKHLTDDIGGVGERDEGYTLANGDEAQQTGAPTERAGSGRRVPGVSSGVRGIGLAQGGLKNEIAQQGTAQLAGRKVKSASELAEMAQILRSPHYETLRYFFVKDGRIVHTSAVTSRQVSSVHSFHPDSLGGSRQGLDWLNSQMKESGADGWYMLHNHPSGDPTPSQADINMTRGLADKVDGFLGHVVINSGFYSTINRGENGDISTQTLALKNPPAKDSLHAPAVEGMSIGKRIRAASDLAEHAKHVEMRDDVLALIGVSHGRTKAIFEVPAEILRHPVRGRAAIRRLARRHGLNRLVAVGNAKALDAADVQGLLDDGFLLNAMDIDTHEVMGNKMPIGPGKATIAVADDDRTPDLSRQQALAKAGLQAYGQTPAERMSEQVSAAWNRHKSTLGQRLEEGLFNRFAPLARAEKQAGNFNAEDSAYVAARLSTGASSVVTALLTFGQAQWQDGVIQKVDGTKGLLDILEPVRSDLDAWAAWMVARRAEYLARSDRENNLSAQDIRELKQVAYDAGFTDAMLEDVAAKVREFNTSVLEIARGAGLLNAKQVREYSKDEYYIPFYRVDDDDADPVMPFARRGLSHQASGIKQLKGGKKGLNDPLANMMGNVTRLVDASLKNHASSLAVRNLPEHFERLPKTADKTKKNVVRVMHNGKPRYYATLDPAILRAMQGFQPDGWRSLLAVPRFFKRLLTSSVTADPAFIIRNYTRDMLQAWAMNRGEFTPIIDSFKGLKSSFHHDESAQAIMFAGASFQGGAQFGGDFDDAADSLRRAMAKKGFPKNASETLAVGPRFWQMYRSLGEAVENANRSAIYDAMMKKSGSVAEAVYESKDLMDFSLQGSWAAVRVLADMVPFFNARLQGLYKLGRVGGEAIKDPSTRKDLIFAATAISLASIALLWANEDEEEWQALSDEDKDLNWHVFVGGTHWRIPKPFEVGALFGTMPERIAMQMMGHDGQVFERTIWMLNNTFNMDVRPQFIKPAWEAKSNYDWFRDSPIENLSDRNKLPEARFGPYTSETMKSIGAEIGASPKMLEHLVQGYFGTLGGYVVSAIDGVINWSRPGDPPDMKLRDYPVLGSFMRSGDPQAIRYSRGLYDTLREAEQVYRTVREYQEAHQGDKAIALANQNIELLRARKTLKTYADRMRKIRDGIQKVSVDPAMSGQEKRQRIRNYERMLHTVSKRAFEVAQQAG